MKAIITALMLLAVGAIASDPPPWLFTGQPATIRPLVYDGWEKGGQSFQKDGSNWAHNGQRIWSLNRGRWVHLPTNTEWTSSPNGWESTSGTLTRNRTGWTYRPRHGNSVEYRKIGSEWKPHINQLNSYINR